MHGSEGGRKSTPRSPLPRLIFPAITSVHEAVRETAQRKEHVHGPNYPYVARSVRGLESRPAQAALPRAVRGRIEILVLVQFDLSALADDDAESGVRIKLQHSRFGLFGPCILRAAN